MKDMKWNKFKNNVSRYGIIWAVLLVVAVYAATGCMKNYPVDDDKLLITTRTECYVSSFGLIGVDAQNVLTSSVTLDNGIDSIACTINATVFYGTDLKNVYPRFSLATDARLDPKITGYVDFSSLSRQWTVISGNQKIRKTYTVNLTVQTPTQ